MEPLTPQTPSPDHFQFDQICAELDEFEPLPAVSSEQVDFDEESGLDDQILAALVTPAY